MSSDMNVRLSEEQRNELSRRMTKIRLQQPEEFHRKIRAIQHHAKFKATDYRFILLFAGPVILKGILDKNRYQHYLLLHVACRMLSMENATEYVEYVKNELFSKLIILAKHLYGSYECTQYNASSGRCKEYAV